VFDDMLRMFMPIEIIELFAGVSLRLTEVCQDASQKRIVVCVQKWSGSVLSLTGYLFKFQRRFFFYASI